ncbi:MAG: TIGR04282 family arsenosugar biosynthesis glycosyltransferase [Planctomycetia bacterium]|nr:TIGR04282 family arsenosugar biosynthesis glycosyltransferase [Planctomycetia bacterium]
MLLVFVRYPEAGTTKTRLIPAVGAVAAAEIQHRMSLHTLTCAREFSHDANIDVEVRFAGGTVEQIATLYGADLKYRDQGAGDLGPRLARATADAFLAGARRVIVIGTDCPALSVQHLRGAHDALVEADVVLGPAADGGYYLIGVREPHPELFEGIAWSSEWVLAQTLSAADRLGLAVQLLETLADVDRPEDLRHVPG